MSEEKRPKVTVGAYIENKEGKILLARSAKWNGMWTPPGGHIEYGEKIEDAVLREVKEETGLEVSNPIFLSAIDMIEPKDFMAYKSHFIGLQYKVTLKNEDQEVELEERELTEGKWFTPEEIVNDKEVEKITRGVVEKFILNKDGECDSCDEYKTGWARAQADYQNLQKQVEEHRSELVRLSELQILEKFIPVYDNFKKSIDAPAENEKQMENWKKGVEYIMKQFADILGQHDVEEIPTVGKQFDPAMHEAISEEEGDAESGTIIKEVDAGYTMKGKVIKAAKVILTK